MKQRILIIDDDMDLCKLLKNNLEQEGTMSVLVMIPQKNGYEVLEKIREKNFVPVLMLTAKDSEGDKVSGLRMGADDYLTKSFSNSEFLARVSSLLRRYTLFNSTNASGKVIRVGNLVIDKCSREVCKNNHLNGIRL